MFNSRKLYSEPNSIYYIQHETLLYGELTEVVMHGLKEIKFKEKDLRLLVKILDKPIKISLLKNNFCTTDHNEVEITVDLTVFPVFPKLPTSENDNKLIKCDDNIINEVKKLLPAYNPLEKEDKVNNNIKIFPGDKQKEHTEKWLCDVLEPLLKDLREYTYSQIKYDKKDLSKDGVRRTDALTNSRRNEVDDDQGQQDSISKSIEKKAKILLKKYNFDVRENSCDIKCNSSTVISSQPGKLIYVEYYISYGSCQTKILMQGLPEVRCCQGAKIVEIVDQPIILKLSRKNFYTKDRALINLDIEITVTPKFPGNTLEYTKLIEYVDKLLPAYFSDDFTKQINKNDSTPRNCTADPKVWLENKLSDLFNILQKYIFKEIVTNLTADGYFISKKIEADTLALLGGTDSRFSVIENSCIINPIYPRENLKPENPEHHKILEYINEISNIGEKITNEINEKELRKQNEHLSYELKQKLQRGKHLVDINIAEMDEIINTDSHTLEKEKQKYLHEQKMKYEEKDNLEKSNSLGILINERKLQDLQLAKEKETKSQEISAIHEARQVDILKQKELYRETKDSDARIAIADQKQKENNEILKIIKTKESDARIAIAEQNLKEKNAISVIIDDTTKSEITILAQSYKLEEERLQLEVELNKKKIEELTKLSQLAQNATLPTKISVLYFQALLMEPKIKDFKIMNFIKEFVGKSNDESKPQKISSENPNKFNNIPKKEDQHDKSVSNIEISKGKEDQIIENNLSSKNINVIDKKSKINYSKDSRNQPETT